ncbi:hypothetical protein PPL_03510 [Heterostelium album PN500]|uniref:Uncharacterized protein n=1 Tax=Heterostelium pallidum (strain ATCC 26659 / Pp 5 / PN500) TaxID=670386 RepID=D3B520_HETP5|nr:hypothetical protein PPL_03510 [Heterostelium album PN500]EFA83498.1 hypothetical protein PPL_03510 [Heterostelium album PN500]|eukprot:XP_020435615.1 hypothetical protein PPL_03510 [Heterostelium album PN500]
MHFKHNQLIVWSSRLSRQRFSDANESTVGDGPATQSQGVLLRYIYYQQQQQLQQRQQQHFEILSIRLITIEIIKCNAETITFRADLQISMTIEGFYC